MPERSERASAVKLDPGIAGRQVVAKKQRVELYHLRFSLTIE